MTKKTVFNAKRFILMLSLVGLALLINRPAQASSFLSIDSIGVENLDGKEIILHRLVAKESYYSLGRRYQVNQKDISAFNDNKRLKIGQIVKIPTNRNFSSAANQIPILKSTDIPFTEYKVGKGETLYTIAKRFQVKIDDIISFNALGNKAIQPNQTLRIPQDPLPAPILVETPILEETVEEEFSLPANRYGLTQVNDRGIGVWMENLNTADGKMLALHKTAPVGTVIKITNPMTKRTTYAKVVGKYNDNNDTREAIIVISKATASLLGVIDKRFLINISYGVPN